MLGEMGLLRILATSLVFLCPLLPVGAEVIRVKGSDTLGAKLVPLLAEAFKARNPGLSIEITAEGSSSAFSELARGTADIGMATRRPRPGEIAAAAKNGIRFEEIVACHDIFAVVVHKDNPVPGLTKEQVAGIFTGKIRDWREVGGTPGPTRSTHATPLPVLTRSGRSWRWEVPDMLLEPSRSPEEQEFRSWLRPTFARSATSGSPIRGRAGYGPFQSTGCPLSPGR